MANALAMVLNLDRDHMEKLGGSNVDAERPDYMEQDDKVSTWANMAMALYADMTGRPRSEEANQMFALGYLLHRINEQLGFELNEHEFFDSVLETLFANNTPTIKRHYEEKFRKIIEEQEHRDGRD